MPTCPAPRANSTACNSAKAAAATSLTAAEAAVEAARGQLDLLKRGGTPAQQTGLQAAADQAQAQVNTARARQDALTGGGIAAERAQAEAQKQQAQGQLVQAQASLKVAQANLHALKSGNLDAQVKSAQAQVTAATERLKSDHARLDVTLRGAPDEDVAQAQAAVDQAQQQLLKARQPNTASDLQQQEQAVAAAAAQLHKAENPYTDQDLAAAQAAVDGAQAQLDAAQLQLAQSTIVAPVDGVVAERMTAPGALASPQTPLMTLVPPSLEVVVNVDESHVGQLASGQNVELEVAAFPGKTFPAQVDSISPTLDAKTRTAAVHVQPNDTDTGLRAGMFAQLSIVTAEKRNVLLVPKAAVASADNQSRVVVIDNTTTTTARLQPVTLGLQNDNLAEVLTGLDTGQLVVTSGLANLHDGDVVAPHIDARAALAQTAAQ